MPSLFRIFAKRKSNLTKCKNAPCPDAIHDMASEHGDLLYLPYLAPSSLRMFLFPDRVASIISTISAGETMNGFFGKCLRLPVTRKDSSLLRATSFSSSRCSYFLIDFFQGHPCQSVLLRFFSKRPKGSEPS